MPETILESALGSLRWGAARTDGMSSYLSPAECRAVLAELRTEETCARCGHVVGEGPTLCVDCAPLYVEEETPEATNA